MPPPPLADALRATPVATVGDAIAVMEAVLAALPRADGVAAFTDLYLEVTKGVRDAIVATRFEDLEFTERLDVAFANLFFDALRAWVACGAVPSAWAVLFDARARRGVLRLQFAFAGMNAHINRDLPLALVATLRTAGGRLCAGSPRHRDFVRINTLLAATEAQVKARFVEGLVRELDVALGAVDDVLAIWKVERARDAAWVNGETLWALRRAPELEAAFLRTLDRMVGFAGRGLLRPVLTR